MISFLSRSLRSYRAATLPALAVTHQATPTRAFQTTSHLPARAKSLWAGTFGRKLPPLVFTGTPELLEPATEVAVDDIKTPEFQEKLEVLRLVKNQYEALGIAGPQIGWYQRVFCFGMEKASKKNLFTPESLPFQFWINPTVVPDTGAKPNWMWEQCLSVPYIAGWVERPEAVWVEGYDERGDKRSARLDGIQARVFQHEFDHLDGILFPERVNSATYMIPALLLNGQKDWKRDWPSPGSQKALGLAFEMSYAE